MSGEIALAKLNLHLRILAREESGFHQLETVFCALELCDSVEWRPGPGPFRLEVEGADLGDPDGNLVTRAARAFHASAGTPLTGRARLVKRIPAGSGLGGGSSDAAAMLRLLARAYPGAVPNARLRRIAAELGSDVAFFLSGADFALAWGRGERLLPLPPPPAAPVLLVQPPIPTSTAEAYRLLAAERVLEPTPIHATVLDAAELSTWAGLARFSSNDFEPTFFRGCPAAAEAHRVLSDRALLARLTGSGSALFGIFAADGELGPAREEVRRRWPDWTVIETRTVAAASTPSR